MKKIQTTKISGGAEYAKVADRLKIFWEENPRGKIKTTHQISGEYIIFTTEIIVDQSNEYSRSATGSAMEKLGGKVKTFEKTESVSVGRALALLGYLASGEIASFEEMEEFEKFKDEKEFNKFEAFKNEVDKIKTVEDLRVFFSKNKGNGKEYDEYMTNKAEELKAKTITKTKK